MAIPYDVIAFFGALVIWTGLLHALKAASFGRFLGFGVAMVAVMNLRYSWGDRYDTHPSWGVAFYDRFTTGPASRTNLLFAHIGANTIAFLIMQYQLLRPGNGSNAARHRLLGRASTAAQ